VRVGGEFRGVTPLEAPVFVAPGAVVVEVKKDGHETAFRYVSAAAGKAHDLSFTLSAKPAEPQRGWAAPAVAFGFGGAGLLTGVIAGSIAAAKLSDLGQVCGPDLSCPSPLRGDAEMGRAAAHVATVGFIAAGLGAAVGVTLLVVPVKKSQAQVGLEIGPSFVGVKGAF
jgi:hypothetical protein